MLASKAESVRQHYDQGEGNSDLVTRIMQMLDSMAEPVTTKQLAPLDQFHVKGLMGTKELADLAGVQPDMSILDAGSGLGGPARYLAESYGCQVSGVDLTPSYVDLASALTLRTGLADRVTFQVGNLLALPFPDAHFNLVWTQHAAMNIGDRDQLYREFRRVLKAGGKLAFHDLYAPDDKPELLFPVPWAESQTTSFLLTKAETMESLRGAGFQIDVWNEDTEQSMAALAAQTQALPPSEQSLHLMAVVGTRLAGMVANLVRNLREGRVRAVVGVCRAA